MELRGIDGVVLKRRIERPRGVRIAVRVVQKQRLTVLVSSAHHVQPVQHPAGPMRVARKPLAYAVVALILVSFTAGMWTMWQTHASFAENDELTSIAGHTPPGSMPIQIEAEPHPSQAGSSIAIYNMPLEQLEYYLEEGYKTPEMKRTELLQLRTEKLRVYLASKKSPLADIADTLAALQHWRLVIAISNSESSLGKRCADNNCSGIGVKPGHPLWREYETKADWAQDLDALIEKRYKNWSLEQMDGVYNNPGSENWVFAAQQILTDLKDVE
mgnify:CR=1 FL=1